LGYLNFGNSGATFIGSLSVNEGLQPRDIDFRLRGTAVKPFEQIRVAGSTATNQVGAHSALCGKCFDTTDDVMNFVHKRYGYICNPASQVTTVPLTTPRKLRFFPVMADNFSDALLWHMDRAGHTIAELARGSGVSASAIKQLRARSGSGTSAKTGAQIAAFYGKSYQSFLRCEENASDEDALREALTLLSPAERKMILLQIRGLVAGRASDR
jgi:hypothetical protein